MAKDEYAAIVAGGLKFKGDGVKKKKKKHSSKTKATENAEDLSKAVTSKVAGDPDIEGVEQGDSKTGEEMTAEQLRELHESRMTESERAFARAKRERMLKGDKDVSLKSYEERKQQFAKSLAEAPEHNDMPKVGPG